jgi:hypothetical protein
MDFKILRRYSKTNTEASLCAKLSHWEYRVCAGCGNNLRADEYNNREWSFPVGL